MGKIRELKIGSLGELVDAVTPPEPDPRTGRRRDSGVYRGTADIERTLLTSLDRLGGVERPHAKVALEEHILRNFMRHARPHLGDAPVNEWEVLVSAQHHGVPTRLLDWTYSPLVAAHFATLEPEQERDRVIWRLDWRQVHRKFGLPELALLIDDVARTFGDGTEAFTPWALFGGHMKREFACMIEPPSLDARIVAQSAVFTLCTDRSRSFDAFLAEHGLRDALTRYVIPGEAAGKFRDQLDLVGIDERRLFPDLDGVAAEIRR
ncbi:MAG TPA: FRG domain-containing protein, partial [Gemmatimonadaceae bacterium]